MTTNRTVLGKVYFMGNGGDMGSSHIQTTPTAQGHEAGNLSAGGTK